MMCTLGNESIFPFVDSDYATYLGFLTAFA